MVIHQVSTSSLLGNLVSSFVSMGWCFRHRRQSFFPFDCILCCPAHHFVQWHPELALEISVNYRPDVIFVCTTARRSRSSCQSCVIWCRLLQPLVQRCRRHSSYPLCLLSRATSQKKVGKKKWEEKDCPIQNNQEALRVPQKIINMWEFHNF